MWLHVSLSRHGFLGSSSIRIQSVLLAMLILGATPAMANRSITGEWSGTLQLQSRAVHMTLLKGVNGYHSRIVWWPEDNNVTSSSIWDWNPGSEVPNPPATATTNSNLFCAGHSVLATGDILATGGTESGDTGIKETNLLARTEMTWTEAGEMDFDRWYPTNTTLADGSVFVSAGWEQSEALLYGGTNGTSEFGTTHVLKMRNSLEWPGISLAASPSPGNRQFHSAAELNALFTSDDCQYDWNRYLTLIYGGEQGTSVLSDLWGLRWDRRYNTYKWHNPTTGGINPGPLCRHTAVMDPAGHRMLVYGGLRGVGNVSNTLYRLNNVHPAGSDCLSSLSWDSLAVPINSPRPPALFGHNSMYDARRNRMIVFGGRNNTKYFNQVWLLHLGDSPHWEGPLALDVPGVAPAGRAGAFAVFDTTRHSVDWPGISYSNNRMLVFGGFQGVSSWTPVSDTLWSGTIIDK